MKKLLVTMAERNWIREHASLEMGKTIKYRVIDLDKTVARIRKEREENNLSPYIDIIPLHPDMHKVPNKMPTYQKDPITGVLYGVPNGEDEYGNIKWQRLQMSDSLSLNLDVEMECRIWTVLRFNSDIEGSPFQKQNPYYKVFDPVDQAKAEIDEITHMRKAFDLFDRLKASPKEMVFFARYLGEDLRSNSNRSIVEGAISRYARNNPVDFINKFEAKERSFAERFFSALSLGIIEQHPDKGYTYRNMPLGHSQEEAIKMMSMDNSLITAINNLILEKDNVMRIVEAEFTHKAMKIDKDVKEKKKEKILVPDAEGVVNDEKDDFD